MPFAESADRTEAHQAPWPSLNLPAPQDGQKKSRGVWVAAALAAVALGGGVAVWLSGLMAHKPDLPSSPPDTGSQAASQPAKPPGSGSVAITPTTPSGTKPTIIERSPEPWYAELIREGKVHAPDLSKLESRIFDDLSQPGRFPNDKDKGHGYENGRYFIHNGFWNQLWKGSAPSYFACEVSARVTGPGTCGMQIQAKEKGGIAVSLNNKGEFRIEGIGTNASDSPTIKLPWTRHTAILEGDKFNTVLVIVRGREIEVYANRKALCGPVQLDRDITPSTVALASHGTKNIRGEFKDFAIWQQINGVPTLEARIASLREMVTPYVWTVEAMKDGRIVAPDMNKWKPWFQDKFLDSKSGFPEGKFEQGERGYRNGRYYVHLNQGRASAITLIPLEKVKPPRPLGDFACQVTTKLNGAGSYGFAIMDGPEPNAVCRLRATVGSAGRWQIGVGAGDTEADNLLNSGHAHPAIQKGIAPVNTLLVIVRGRQLEFYINGVAVSDPVLLERELPNSARLGFYCFAATKGAVFDFENLSVWSAKELPPLDKRGAAPKTK
jgi:hypothetical protein